MVFLAAGFFLGDAFAVVTFVDLVVFLAAGFLVATFVTAGFFFGDAVTRLVAFAGVAFFATVFFAGDFFAAGFFLGDAVAVVFFAVRFAVVVLLAVFFATDFFAVLAAIMVAPFCDVKLPFSFSLTSQEKADNELTWARHELTIAQHPKNQTKRFLLGCNASTLGIQPNLWIEPTLPVFRQVRFRNLSIFVGLLPL